MPINSIDLVLGGDHGQEKFQMVMKIICRDELQNIVDEWVVKIAHIDCQKDTYQVLRETIMPKLNEYLKKY